MTSHDKAVADAIVVADNHQNYKKGDWNNGKNWGKNDDWKKNNRNWSKNYNNKNWNKNWNQNWAHLPQ